MTWVEVNPNPAEQRRRESDFAMMKEHNDAIRPARRAKIKEQLAENKLLEVRYSELLEECRESEGKLDVLAAEHQAACAPLQAQLKSLEDSAIQSILCGDSTGEIDSKKREVARRNRRAQCGARKRP